MDLDSAIGAVGEERNALARLAGALTVFGEGVQKLVANISTLDFARVAMRATSSTTYKARANMHISLDAGLLGAHDVREIVPYIGVNWYLRPVNKDAPLEWRCWKSCFRRRFAFTVGVSATSVKQQDRIEDLVSSRALLLGAGLRVTDYVRATGGALIVKSYVNGVDNRPEPHGLLAGAASLDIDVIQLLGKVASALIPNL